MRHSGFLLALSIAGCALPPQQAAKPKVVSYRPEYEVQLVQVERPAKAKERYGEQRISTLRDSSVSRYAFEDQMVRVVAFVSDRGVDFDLTNKTDNTIKLPWNDAAFVGIDGKSEPVMHVGVKYNECSGQKAPSVIVRHESISDLVIPCSNVRFGYSDWIVSSPFPTEGATALGDTAAQRKTFEAFKGTRVSLLLPLQIEDVVNDYIFTFEVKDVQMHPQCRGGGWLNPVVPCPEPNVTTAGSPR